MAELQIEDIRKVSFKKGDVLVVKAPITFSDNQYAKIVADCRKVLPEGVGLLILDNGKDIAVLEKEED